MWAFVSVSIVVNVFDDTTNSVSAGSSPASAPAMSAPSTLDTKRAASSGWRNASSARAAIAGPRSEPPMPMLTTVRMRLPVAPVHAPSRT